MPRVVAVGAKRLFTDGRVFSMGEFVVHPKGFHHQGQGVPGSAYRFPEEVDVISGGVLAIQAQAFQAAGGIELLSGELGALTLGLVLRRAGGRCVVVPHVVVTDEHTPQPDEFEQRTFREHWGFDYRAADLAAVRRDHAGSGLLWNVRFHARGMPFEKYVQRPTVHWDNYDQVDVYRQRADHLATLVKQICPTGRVLDMGCGDGLFSHLFAMGGAQVTGIDPEPQAIEQAREKTRQRQYPVIPPRFLLGSGEQLDLPEAGFDAVIMLDVIEHLPNPVAVLRQVRRLLAPGGALLVSTPGWQFGAWSDPVYHVTEYTMDELVRQIQAATGLKVTNTGIIKGVYRDLIVIAKNTD